MAARTDSKQLREIIASVLASNNQILGVETPQALPLLLSQLAAAPGQVPNSAPPAPTGGANQPASGVLPQGAPSTGGFQPAFESALNQLLAASGGKVWVTSGYRSPERQAQLYEAALQKYGSEHEARKWVAPPGKSRHGMGLAADLGGDLEWVRRNAGRFGLYQPMPWEDWHWELQGSR